VLRNRSDFVLSQMQAGAQVPKPKVALLVGFGCDLIDRIAEIV
jgi:hypothetical protein